MVDSLISRRYIKGSSYVYEGFRNDHEPRLPVHVLRILWYTYNGEADAATGRSSTVSSQQPLRVQLLNRTRAWCYPSAWAILAFRQGCKIFVMWDMTFGGFYTPVRLNHSAIVA